MQIGILVIVLGALAAWWFVRRRNKRNAYPAAGRSRRNFGNPGNGYRFQQPDPLDKVEPQRFDPEHIAPLPVPPPSNQCERPFSLADDSSFVFGPDGSVVVINPTPATAAKKDCSCSKLGAGGENVTCLKCRSKVL